MSKTDRQDVSGFNHIFDTQRTNPHLDDFSIPSRIDGARKEGAQAWITGKRDILAALDHFWDGFAGDA